MQSIKDGVKDNFEAFGLLSYSSAKLNLSARPLISSWHCLQTTTLLVSFTAAPQNSSSYVSSGLLRPSIIYSTASFSFLPLCDLALSSPTHLFLHAYYVSCTARDTRAHQRTRQPIDTAPAAWLLPSSRRGKMIFKLISYVTLSNLFNLSVLQFFPF